MYLYLNKVYRKFVIYYNYIKIFILLIATLVRKECYFGPFVGEFGHLLSHVLPFISYLNRKGVKIHYCGPDIHKPYFQKAYDGLLVTSYFGLRDFYSEVTPNCNEQIIPEDVRVKTVEFIDAAKKSNLPYWNIGNEVFYWDVFCKWEYKYNFINTIKYMNKPLKYRKKTVALFARKKGGYSPVRGDDWNFQEIADLMGNYVDEVFVIGHPAFSHNIKPSKNVKVVLTNDNSKILEICASSRVIINQLSGTHYLGVFLDTPVMLLLKGENVDFSNIKKDSQYRKLLGEKYCWEIVKNNDELLNKVFRYV